MEFLDAFLGAFLGVWATSPGLWAGRTSLGPLLVVLLGLVALYLQGLRLAVDAPVGSVGHMIRPIALATIGVLVVAVIALGAFSHQVSWPANVGYGTIMAAWVGSVYIRPWMRRVAVVLGQPARSEAAAGRDPTGGPEDE